MLEIYTDGSYQASINAGGYATVITENNKVIKQLYQGFKNTTNNRMELYGVIIALEEINDEEVVIYSDSSYVISSINGGYAKKWLLENDETKKNLDLWKRLIPLLEGKKVTFKWVKGHNENKYNELADLLAVHAAQCLNLPQDVA